MCCSILYASWAGSDWLPLAIQLLGFLFISGVSEEETYGAKLQLSAAVSKSAGCKEGTGTVDAGIVTVALGVVTVEIGIATVGLCSSDWVRSQERSNWHHREASGTI